MECCGCEICFVFYFCVLGAPPAARFVDARLAALRRRQLASVMCVFVHRTSKSKRHAFLGG